MLTVVLDPNVLIAAAITPRGVCGEVLDAAIGDRYAILASSLLLAELAQVLARPTFRRYLSQNEAREFIALVGKLATLHADEPAAAGLTRDPNDDYLVTLAQTTGADYLVSGDQDLLDLTHAHPPVLTPRAFLDLLTASASES